MPRPFIFGLQLAILGLIFASWHVLTTYPILAVPSQMQFFFSRPLDVLGRVVQDVGRADTWYQLGVTLEETVLAFAGGAIGGIALGFALARNATAAAVCDPFIKVANALPRVVLAPIFVLWFGLGIWSKVALGSTLVIFVVFFNVYQGISEVPVPILQNARMLGMTERMLLRHVYWPAALSWVFSSLHTSVGFALVGAVVGEYLGAAAGLGYKIQEAESVFDVTGVFSGIVILSAVVVLLDAGVTAVERRLLMWRARS